MVLCIELLALLLLQQRNFPMIRGSVRRVCVSQATRNFIIFLNVIQCEKKVRQIQIFSSSSRNRKSKKKKKLKRNKRELMRKVQNDIYREWTKKNNRNTRASQTTNIKYLWIIRDDGYTEYTDCYKSVYSLYYFCTSYELYMAAERCFEFTKLGIGCCVATRMLRCIGEGNTHIHTSKRKK